MIIVLSAAFLVKVSCNKIQHLWSYNLTPLYKSIIIIIIIISADNSIIHAKYSAGKSDQFKSSKRTPWKAAKPILWKIRNVKVTGSTGLDLAQVNTLDISTQT